MRETEDWQLIYQEFAEIIGKENTRLVFENFKGTTVNFPLRLVRRERLVATVKREYQQGATVHELSIEHVLAERTIHKYLNE
ncbi:hypothetical protein [Latilactobacillus sakei]|uniref:hypothetical protein n=1 Tax=Latilactobacillus sakei TaxID=1599 RepID=UPI00241F17FA|nr:hypothetical protein [Latilactobacillus sakei]